MFHIKTVFKNVITFVLTTSLLIYIITPTLVFAFNPQNVTNEDRKTVKVAFIPDGNFYIQDTNGDLSGYNYDYITKVSQFTDWDLEFVIIHDDDINLAYEKAYDMLENGEIDLIGSQEMTMDNLDKYQFGQNHYSVVRTTLSSLANNHRVTRNNFFLNDSIDVALVVGNDNINNIFYSIAEKFDIKPNVTYVESQELALQLLIQEDVDAIMSTDFSTVQNTLSTLFSENPIPIYFIATKGNVDLVNQIDYAIEQIQTTTLTVSQDLQEKYFGNTHNSALIRTVAENDALANLEHLNVGFIAGLEPYQFYDYDNNQFSGISVEILESISSIIKFPFNFHWFESYDDLIVAIDNGEIDIFATLPFDFNITNSININLSQPYISNRATWVYRYDTYSSYDTAYKYFVSDNIPFYLAEHLDYVYNGSEIFSDISQNGESVVFCDPYIAQYALQALNITNLEMRSVPNIYSNISMGVAKHVDPAILGLLNHSILHLDSYFIDEAIHRHTIVNEELTFDSFFKQYSEKIVFILVLFFSFIIAILTFYALKFKNLSRQDSMTKLVNSGYFHKFAEENTKKMDHGCLIIIDIDNFKQINDLNGHHVGDDVIKKVSQLLLDSFRSTDVIGRLGGDEFVALLKYNASIEELNSRSNQLLKSLADSFDINVTLSIGGVIFSEPMFYDNLYRLTDEVLYSVKKNGRNGYSFKEYPIKDEI